MDNDEIKALFDQQAPGYDERWAKTAPIREALHCLLEAVFADLPAGARLLCVGAGTGEELIHLASRFPGWTFVAVDPSAAMIARCRAKADAAGILSRCDFHEGFLDTLADQAPFDGATSFLVSQFIQDRIAREAYFRGIAARLVPGGILASSDLAADVGAPAYDDLLEVWFRLMRVAGLPAAGLEQMRAAYARDVAVLPPTDVAAIIAAGGFEAPVPFYQAGLIHGWFTRRRGSGGGIDGIDQAFRP